MSWPDDDRPRFVVDTQPTVRVLDRAYCDRIVREWVKSSSPRRAVALAAALNAAERDQAAA